MLGTLSLTNVNSDDPGSAALDCVSDAGAASVAGALSFLGASIDD